MGKEISPKSIKKVVIICPYLFELQRGVERYCLGLADALISNGISVTIYAWTAKTAKACGSIQDKIKIRIVPNKRYYRDRVASAFYRLWLSIDNPDITILNFMYHGEEYLPKGRPYLYILHSPASQIPSRYQYVKDMLPRFKRLRVIAISQMVQNEAKPYMQNIPMSLIYNGTDTSIFKPQLSADNNGKFRIISAAAFEERKGMHFIIEALKDFELNNEIEYHIYGGGNEKYSELLKSLIDKYNLNNVVKLMGSVTNISELMPQYDMFALPSKGEAFALSPIEAMACGLPILVSDCPPYPEFVDESFGFMVDRNNPEQIKDAIRTLVNDRSLLHSMKLASQKKSEEFSWSHVVKQYIKAMEETI